MFERKCRALEHDYLYVSFSRFGGYYECLNCMYRPSMEEYKEWADA